MRKSNIFRFNPEAADTLSAPQIIRTTTLTFYNGDDPTTVRIPAGMYRGQDLINVFRPGIGEEETMQFALRIQHFNIKFPMNNIFNICLDFDYCIVNVDPDRTASVMIHTHDLRNEMFCIFDNVYSRQHLEWELRCLDFHFDHLRDVYNNYNLVGETVHIAPFSNLEMVALAPYSFEPQSEPGPISNKIPSNMVVLDFKGALPEIKEQGERSGERCNKCVSYLEKHLLHIVLTHEKGYLLSSKTAMYLFEKIPWCAPCMRKFSPDIIQSGYNYIVVNQALYERRRRIRSRETIQQKKLHQQRVCALRLEEAKKHVECENSVYPKEHKKKTARVHHKHKFVPEAFISVSLDNSSKEFMTSLVKQLIDGAGGLAEKVSKTPVVKVKFDFFSNFWESCKHFYEWIAGLFGPIKKAILFLVELVCSFVKGPLQSVFSFILIQLGIRKPEDELYADEMVVGTALDSDDDEKRLPENYIIPEGKENAIAIGIIGLLYSRYLKTMIDWGDFRMFARGFVEAIKTSEGLGGLIRPIYEFFCNILNSLLEYFGSEKRIDTYWFRNSRESRFFERLKDIRDGISGHRYTPVEASELLFILRDDVDYYLSHLPNEIKSSTVLRMQALSRALHPLVEEAERNVSPDRGARMEPLTIGIAGASGVGKSVNTHPIIFAILTRLLPQANLPEFQKNNDDFVFFRNSINEFWEGYLRSHFAIIYDDWGQLVDTAGVPNRDFLELIRLKNISPYHLHMAALEKKAGSFAHPKIVFCSTNITKLQAKSISCPEAVERRFDIFVVQVPKLQYCTDPHLDPLDYLKRRLDPARVYAEKPYDPNFPKTAFPSDIFDFIEWDLGTGAPRNGGRVYSSEELIQLSINKFKHLRTKWDQVREMHKTIINEQVQLRNPSEFLPGNVLINDHEIREPNIRPEGFFYTEVAHCTWCKKKLGEGDAFVDSMDTILLEHRSHCLFLQVKPTMQNSSTLSKVFRPWQFFKDSLGDFVKWLTDKAFAAVFNGVKMLGDKTCSKLAQIGKYLAYLAGALATGFLGLLAIKKILHVFSPGIQEESGPNGNQRNKEKAPSKAKPKGMVIVPQGSVENNIQFLDSVWRKSLYALRIKRTGVIVGFVLFIKGATFVCPFHFNALIMGAYEGHDDEKKIVELLWTDSRSVYYSFDWDCQKMIAFDGKDIMFGKIISEGLRPHQDLTGSGKRSCVFLSEDDERVKMGRTYRAHLPVYGANKIRRDLLVSGKIAPSTEYGYKKEGLMYYNNKLEYIAPTKPGDCGAVLVPDDDAFSIPTIIGIHNAGYTEILDTQSRDHRCLGYFISKELVIDALQRLEQAPADDISEFEIPIPLPHEENDDVKEAHVTPDDRPLIGEFRAEGVYNNFPSIGYGPVRNIPGNTKIRKSQLYNKLWTPTMAPARLKPFYLDGEYVNPLHKAQAKYFHDESYVDEDLMHEVMKDFAAEVLSFPSALPWPPRLFTMKEAVDGIIGVKGAEGIDRSTSQGAPDVWLPGTKVEKLGKKQEFDEHRVQFSEIRSDILKTIDLAENGARRLHLYLDCLKDERRKLEKVRVGSTRQFMCVSQRYLIPFKMYFGDFMRQVQQPMCRLANGCAVGINPYNEWGEIVRLSMRVEDPVFIAGDFEAYDGRLRAQLLGVLLEVIELFYLRGKDFTIDYLKEKMVRNVLYAEVFNSIHLVEGVIYMFSGSQASGMPMTAILNSMATCLMCYMCICKILKDNGKEFKLRDFWVLAFGDDNIIVVPRKLCHLVTQSLITKYMWDLFEMKYTAEDKSSTVKEYRTIEEITFLKRGFRWDQNSRTWDAPLDIEVLKEILNWEQSTMNMEETELNIESVLFELTLHGEKIYDAHAPLIVQRSLEVYNYTCRGRTFRAAQLERRGVY